LCTPRQCPVRDQYPGGGAEYLGYLGWPLLLVCRLAAGALWQMLAARGNRRDVHRPEVWRSAGRCWSAGTSTLAQAAVVLVERLPLANAAVVDRFSIIADGCRRPARLAIDAACSRSARISRRAAGSMARAAILLGIAVTVVPILPAPLPTVTVAGAPAAGPGC